MTRPMKASPRYLCHLAAMRWIDIRWGYQKGYLSSRSVVEYALCRLHEGSRAAEFAIAAADPNNPWAIDRALDGAVASEESSDASDAQRRWMFAELMYAFETASTAETFFHALEDIYAEFGYPHQLSDLMVWTLPPGTPGTCENLDWHKRERIRLTFECLSRLAQGIGARCPEIRLLD